MTILMLVVGWMSFWGDRRCRVSEIWAQVPHLPPEPTQRSSRTCKTPLAHELGRVATSELTQVARYQPSESEVLDGMECDCGDCEESHPDPTVDACMQTHNLSQVLAERACQETQLPHIGMITVSCLVVLLLIGMFQLKRYHQKWWRDLVHHAFLEVDLDKSGQINEHELAIAVDPQPLLQAESTGRRWPPSHAGRRRSSSYCV